MKPIKHVIFVIVDSVRSYKTGVDDRDRLDFMDEFKKESIEFTNAFTSAPSSVMSAAAMFTGLHSAFVSRNYNDWEFDTSSIRSIQNTLKENGFNIFSIDNSKVGREVKRDLILPLPNSWFPPGISHGKFWTNLEVTRILRHVLKKCDKSQPSFFMLWYDCRDDPNTSSAVKDAVTAFKEHGMYEDALIVLTSDHGYPDPRTGLDKNTMRNMRHDMVVTDDNIKVPLFIKVPGLPAGTRTSLVSTIDFTPTVLDLLELELINQQSKSLAGESLKNILICSEDRSNHGVGKYIRTDTRLLLQSGRITAIRDQHSKLVIYQDENKSEGYDLEADPQELVALTVPKTGGKFRNLLDYFEATQAGINSFHEEIIKNQVIKLVSKAQFKKGTSILVYSSSGTLINDKLLEAFFFKVHGVDVSIWGGSEELTKHTLNNENKIITEVIHINALKRKSFDLCLMITEKAHYVFLDEKNFKLCKRLSRKILSVDCNLKTYNRTFVKWVSPIWKYRRNLSFYLQEPTLIFYDALKIAKLFIKIFLLRDVVVSPDMSLAKELRDRKLIANSEKPE